MRAESRAWARAELVSGSLSAGLLLVALLACGGNRTAAHPNDALPTAAWADQNDPGRGNPWQRLAAFEHAYRSSLPEDEAWNYAAEYGGSRQLLYPKSVRKEAAWTYVLVSRDFSARREWAPAARAAWDALALVRKTLGSRPDRERIRRAAYRELAAVARQRQQAQWAELLELCATLIDVYLETPKARSDQHAFYAVIDKVRKAEEAQARAEAAHDRAAVLGAISTGLQQGQAYAAAGNDPQAVAQTTLRNFEQTMSFANQIADQAAAIREAGEGRAAFLHEFAEVVGDDVTDIEAGLSFAAREVSFFLLSDPERGPYIEAIRRWGREKPKLLALLEQGNGQSADDAVAIAKELQAREVHAARFERRGEAVPYPELAPTPTLQVTAEPPRAKGVAGKYVVMKGVDPSGATYSGSLEVEQYGRVVHMQWDLGSEGKLVGVGLLANGKLFAGWSANSRDVGVTLYNVGAAELTGSWTNLHSGDSTGTEIVPLGGTLIGRHTIATANLPGAGTPYSGTVTIAATRDTFDVRWQLGPDGYRGTGIREGDELAVGWAPGALGAGVSIFKVGEDTLEGTWAPPGSPKVGREELRRAP